MGLNVNVIALRSYFDHIATLFPILDLGSDSRKFSPRYLSLASALMSDLLWKKLLTIETKLIIGRGINFLKIQISNIILKYLISLSFYSLTMSFQIHAYLAL